MNVKNSLLRAKIGRKILKWIAFIIIFIGLIVYFSNRSIVNNAKGKTFSDFRSIPYNKVGLILGTSKYLKNGKLNPYFIYRVDAAVDLFNAKKIDYILVSGDNSTKHYDEPADFKAALIEKGIPADRIYLDYAGFRTLDSVVRAKEIFGQEQFTIISQKFHNERAIFLAQKKDINAVGFNAKDVAITYQVRVQAREYFARVKVFFDLFFDVQPKFFGEKISIGE